MGYKLNIRNSTTSWENILSDTNIEITDLSGYFTSSTLDGVLDELYNATSSGMSWSIISSNTTLSPNNGYLVNTGSNVVTVTLPSSPSIGDTIVISDYSGSFGTNNCVVSGGAENIMGLAEEFYCDINNLGVTLLYADTTQGWRIVSSADGVAIPASGITWSTSTVNVSASVNNGYFINTTSSAVTILLPSSATIGDTIKVTDFYNNFETNNCTISRNGHNIMGVAEDFNCNINGMSLTLTYSDTTKGWWITDYSA